MKYIGYIYLTAYSFLLALIGVFTHYINGMDVQSIVFVRAIMAVIFMVGVIVVQRDWKTFRLVHWDSTLLIGISHTAMLLLFIGALMNTSVANVILYFYSATCCSLLIARVYLSDGIPPASFGNLGFCLAGLLFVANPSELTFTSEELRGSLMALGAGLSYAGLLIWSKPLAGKVGSAYIPLWQHIVVGAILLPLMDFGQGSSLAAATLLENALPLAGLGLLSTGLCYLCLTLGVRLVPTCHALVMTSLEPVMAIVVAAILLGEQVTLWTSIGAAFIVVGVYRITTATIVLPDEGSVEVPQTHQTRLAEQA